MPIPSATTAGSLSSDQAVASFQARARYAFDLDEFARLTGRADNLHAARVSLARLVQRNLIVPVHKRPSVFVIIPAEYMSDGAPPVVWWLHDALTRMVPGYYLALLSAARYWGSLPQAPQVEQVMVEQSRPLLTVGKHKIAFLTRTDPGRAPVTQVRGEKAPYFVSTREATLLDLVKHQPKIGGLEVVARVAKDFGPHLTSAGMLRALDAMGQVAVAQRTGFILSELAIGKVAEVVAQWLAPRHMAARVLGEKQDPRHRECRNTRWRVMYSNSELQTIRDANLRAEA